MPARRLTVAPGAAQAVTESGALVVSVGCREVRRRLGPMSWTVLEDLTLDAHPDGAGGFWARTSARRVAGHLGIEPGTAANALRRLRADGLLTLGREPGPAGRFGPSVYRIATIPGLTIAEHPGPGVDTPRMVTPPPARPVTVEPSTGRPDPVQPVTSEEAPSGPRSKPTTKRSPRSEALTLWDAPSAG